MRIDWDSWFMIMAKVAALRSGCNSRPVGAIAVKDKRVICEGYNGTLPGETQCTDFGDNYCFRRASGAKDNEKYNICPIVHAEMNIITQASLLGISLKGSSIYITLSPCYLCAKALKSSGVEKIYYEYLYESEDKERDKYWLNFLNDQFECKRLTIVDADLSSLNNITSIRRL